MKIECDYDFKIYNNDSFIGIVHSCEEKMLTKKILYKKINFVLNKGICTIKIREMERWITLKIKKMST